MSGQIFTVFIISSPRLRRQSDGIVIALYRNRGNHLDRRDRFDEVVML